MWDDLVQAYESDLAVLEESRGAFSEALYAVMRACERSITDAIAEALAECGCKYKVEAATRESGENARFKGAPWVLVSITDELAGTEFTVSAWVASTWGGPAGKLRVALSLENVHRSLDIQRWLKACRESMPNTAPGEPFDPIDWQRIPESAPQWRSIQIATVSMDDREPREIATEARGIAQCYTKTLDSSFQRIAEASRAMRTAEDLLLEQREGLSMRAEHLGVSISPSRGLGPWRGGQYLQIGNFWLATQPDAGTVVAACNNADRGVLERCAADMGKSTCRIGPHLAVVLLEHDELLDRDHSRNVIESAFDGWFQEKALELLTEDAPSDAAFDDGDQ